MKRLLSISVLMLMILTLFGQSSRFGVSLAPYDTIRILIVFAEVDYTGDTICSDPDLYPDQWNVGELPAWKDDLLDTVWTGSPQAKLTQYYYEASLGKLVVLGDYLVDSIGAQKPIVVQSTSLSTTVYRNETVRVLSDPQVISQLSSQYGTFRTNNNFAQSDFDRWGTNPSGVQKPNSPDGKYDEVWFFFRNAGYPGNNSGYSGGYTNEIFGVNGCFKSGATVRNIFPKNIMTHELNHLFLGGNYFHAGGGLGAGPGYVIPSQGGWSLLGGANSAFLTCNAWDRRRLDWRLVNSYPINARDSLNQNNVYADFDATDSTHEGVYILRDFWITGDALRIKLPNIPSNKHQQWLWLEFHETISGNQSEFDDFMYGDSPCVDEPVAGLYAYIQIEKEDTSGANTYSGYGDYLRFLSARGNFDVDSSAYRSSANCIVGGQQNPLKLGEDNPLTGLNTLEERPFNTDTIPLIRKDEGLRWYLENDGGNIIDNLPCNGTADIAFTENGNSEINIGTNPSSANILTHVSDDDTIAIQMSFNVRRIYINGVSIKILDQIGDSLIKVKIKFDDFDLDNDRRWCADSIMLPSVQVGSDYSLMVGSTLTFDWSTVPTRIYNPILFDSSLYYSDPTVFSMMPNSKCIIDMGGMIIAEDSSTVEQQNGSTLEIEQGGVLWMKAKTQYIMQPGCTLKVKDGGQVIIDDSASFVYNGGTIILEGNTSVIEFQGDLEIADNTTFTFSGAGYVKFSKSGFPSENIVAGTNSKIWLNGSGYTDKVLEISQETMYAHDLAEFKLTNGKAELHSDSRLSVDGPITMSNATITSNTGSNNQHRGLCLFGQNGINISGTKFYNGAYGIYNTQTYGGYSLSLSSCTFEDNEIGLYTIDKSVTLYECTFSDNTDIGWQAVAMTIPSTITRSYFLNNFQGIDYEATSTSGLLIQGESRVDYNDYMGIEFFGGAKLSIDCSDIKYNGTYYSVAPGILLHHGASLNMSPSQSPICEKNYVVGNYYNIMTEDPANPGSSNNYMNYLYLSGGYNYLVPATGTKVITAKTKAYSCLARSIIANNNKWNSQNSSPVWNVDYLTYNANCSPIRPFNITDNSPGYLECNIGGSGTTSIQGGSAISLFSSSENDDLIIQTTDYPGATLSSATSNSSTYLTAYDGAGDDKVALNRILQILNYIHGNSLNASAMQIHGLLNLANEAVAGLGKPQNASLLQSSNSEINDLLSFYTLYKQDFNSSDSSEYLTWFELSLAKAHIYQTLERYDDALSEINLIMPYVYPDQAAVLNRLYCIISTEKDLIDGLLSVDDFNSSIELCNVNFRNMITTDEPSENGGTENEYKELFVFPNPANQSISFVLPKKEQYKVQVITLTGKIMLEEEFNSSEVNLNISSIESGVYFLKVIGSNVYLARFVKE